MLRHGQFRFRPPHTVLIMQNSAEADRRHVGVFREESGQHLVRLAEKGGRRSVAVPHKHINGASSGDLVLVERLPGRSKQAKVVERLGNEGQKLSPSLIALKANGIPHEFPAAIFADARDAVRSAAPAGDDLTRIPFLTIDPSDARDRDDAVCAEPDGNPANPGGHIVWVAIADVSRLVEAGSELDREARLRGNSTYFPDMTVPMLPPELCENACSINAGFERQCIVVRIAVDREGKRLSHEFRRGRIRSRAALDYVRAQSIADGEYRPKLEELRQLIGRLWDAYAALKVEREQRSPLNLDIPERRISLAQSGGVKAIMKEERLDSHRLIEEFMILANVCAAETLLQAKFLSLRRVHEDPVGERIAELARTAVASGLPFAHGNRTTTRRLNELLERAERAECSDHVCLAVLRSLNLARYSTAPAGHFGLNLPNYVHFTSPIRRYADLVVHRMLIRVAGMGPDGISDREIKALDGIAGHISMTERRSASAEREAHARFAADYLSGKVGAEFEAMVTGVARHGIFVRLDGIGAEGIIRRAALGLGRQRFNRDAGILSIAGSGKSYRAGMRLRVRLAGAEAFSGSVEFVPADGDGSARASRKRRRRK